LGGWPTAEWITPRPLLIDPPLIAQSLIDQLPIDQFPVNTYRRDLLVVFTLALLMRGLAALPQTQPNYMDAAYYTVGGQRLAQGYGFNDPYVWNYLDQPTAVPRPSHLYWMPLPSILVAGSQALLGVNYRAAQLPFVALAALLPVIAYTVAWQLSAKRRHARLAALLTIFSAYYLPYWGVPESFAPYAVFGSLVLYWSIGDRSTGNQLIGNWSTGQSGRWLAAGACAGLAHLSRADGFLLLIPALSLQMARQKAAGGRTKFFSPHPSSFILIFSGYLLVMTPWFLRNLSVIGAPLSSAGAQAAWLCNYDELFSYGVRFDVNHLLGCGLDQVVLTRLNGVASGVVHLMAENGLIFMALPIAIGLWHTRRVALIRGALIYLGLLFGVMTIVFTFAGDRGGLFHSTGALLPFFYAAAPIGLDALIGWIAARRRTWQVAPARTVFAIASIGLAIGLSWFVYRGRVLGADVTAPVWNQADQVSITIGHAVIDRGEIDPIVMVNNPPLFTYLTGLRSIVIPNGDEAMLLAAARQFGAQWVVLDANRPAGLAGLYAYPTGDPRFQAVASIEGTQVLQVIAP
jgi:hypothetical protein